MEQGLLSEQLPQGSDQSGGFTPHTMYNPETGEEVRAETEQDHNMLSEMGYVHKESQEGNAKMAGADEMSDVDMAVEEAMASGGMDETGFGTVMASEEEQAALNQILDEIDTRLHGAASENITGIIESSPEPFQGISQAAHSLVMGSYQLAAKEGLEPTMDMYVAENGVVQQTVEMVFEVAEAMGKVSVDDDEVLSAAYMDTLRQIGETLLGSDNPEIREGAQELMVELELGTEIGPEDYAEPSEMPQEGQPMPQDPQMAQGAPQGVSEAPPPPPQAPQQGPMPPMDPNQGMV